MILWTYQARRRLLYPHDDRALKQATSLASVWFTHSTVWNPCAGVQSQQWGALGETEGGESPLGPLPCSPVPGHCSLGSAPALPLLAPRREGWLQNKHISAICWQLSQLRSWKNTPLLGHQGADNKVENLGEHPRGNKGRLNVIFITDTFVSLEKVVTVQEAFSVFSQFSITEDTNPKPNQPLLTKILLRLLILLPCCSLWAFSLLACFRWFLKHHQMVAVDS